MVLETQAVQAEWTYPVKWLPSEKQTYSKNDKFHANDT